MQELIAPETGYTKTNHIKCISGKWKLLIVFNAIFGLLLWFGYFTDYSWVGIFADYLFPFLAASVSVISLFLLSKNKGQLAVRSRLIFKMACFPSLIGGGLAIILMIIMIIPPFSLGFLFALNEISDETLIQSIESPDQSHIANVYFRGVGAYDVCNGRIFIRIRSKWLPLIERDVYKDLHSYADKETHEYICWKDTDTLQIVGEPGGKSAKQLTKISTIADRLFYAGLSDEMVARLKKSTQ